MPLVLLVIHLTYIQICMWVCMLWIKSNIIIILNAVLSVRSTRIKDKIILSLLIPSLMLFLYVVLSFRTIMFFFSLNYKFWHFLQGRFPSNKFPHFLLSEKIFIFLLVLKDNFTRYRILGWWFIFFKYFKYFIPHFSFLYTFWEVGCNSYIYYKEF